MQWRRYVTKTFGAFGIALWFAFLSIPGLNCGGTTPVDENNTNTETGGTVDGSTVDTSAPEPPKPEPPAPEPPSPEPPAPEPPRPEPPAPEPPRPEPPAPEPPSPEPPVADAGPDTTPELPPLPDGPLGKAVFKVNKLILSQNPAEGEDLTGNGKPDNQLGRALSNSNIKVLLSLAGVDVQKQIDDEVAKENIIVLIELVNITDATGQGGSVSMNAYLGVKTGTTGEYKIDPRSLDSNGNPLVTYGRTPIVNGKVVSPQGSFSLLLSLIPNQPPLPAELKNARVRFTIQNQLAGLTQGSIGGALPAKTLDLIPTIGSFGSVLDLLVQSAGSDGQPDIDLDNDGIEKIARSAGTTTCTDGDGSTAVTSPSPCPNGQSTCSCVQNAKMADGFSAYLKFEAVPAKIVP